MSWGTCAELQSRGDELTCPNLARRGAKSASWNPHVSANWARNSLRASCRGSHRPIAASMASPVASGNGRGQSVARGSRSCSIITTSRTLSAGG
eukprot:509193-Pyramimonas_sp.AAC.1